MSQQGSEPVILLDDVFSELDETRRRQLATFAPYQTILTTTNTDVRHRKKGVGLISL
jgi:recombinational DNA repair ATPase RecF